MTNNKITGITGNNLKKEERNMKKNTLVAIMVVVAVVLFSLFPIFSFADSTVEPLTMVERPTWQVGDTWVYNVKIKEANRDIIECLWKLKVVESNSRGYVTISDLNGMITKDFYSFDLNLIRSEDETGEMVISGLPEIPMFRWPLKPGKWWKESYFYQENRGRILDSFNTALTAEVMGSEPLVGIDGKEIATMKIVVKRDNDKKNKKFLETRQIWYDPQTHFVVKRIYEKLVRGIIDERNLVSFTPGLQGTK